MLSEASFGTAMCNRECIAVQECNRCNTLSVSEVHTPLHQYLPLILKLHLLHLLQGMRDRR